MTRGIDAIAPGSLVLIIGDDAVDHDPAQSVFMGHAGTVAPDDAGTGVIVTFADRPGEHAFELHEVRVIEPERCAECAGSGRSKKPCGCRHGCARCDYTGRSVFACAPCRGTGVAAPLLVSTAA